MLLYWATTLEITLQLFTWKLKSRLTLLCLHIIIPFVCAQRVTILYSIRMQWGPRLGFVLPWRELFPKYMFELSSCLPKRGSFWGGGRKIRDEKCLLRSYGCLFRRFHTTHSKQLRNIWNYNESTIAVNIGTVCRTLRDSYVSTADTAVINLYKFLHLFSVLCPRDVISAPIHVRKLERNIMFSLFPFFETRNEAYEITLPFLSVCVSLCIYIVSC